MEPVTLRSGNAQEIGDLLQLFERQQHEGCVERCRASHRACIGLASELDAGYGVAAGAFMALLLDCAEINLMLAASLGSRALNRPLTALCAEIGERCAAECVRCLDESDVESCVSACEQSAAACRHLLALEAVQ